jgi:hypothetical protein
MKDNETDWAYTIMGRREILHIFVLWGKVKMRDHLENLDIDGRIILKWDLKRLHVFLWLRGRTNDGIL